MAKSVVRIMCWHRSHVNDLALNKAQEQKLETDIPKMKKVCPNCKPENSQIVITNGTTVFSPSKAYKCKKGHLSLISALPEMLHVCFGPGSDEFVNVEGHIDDLPNLIDNVDVSCNHVVDGKLCDCALEPVDDFQLTYASCPSVKTRMRIGDMWDKHGIEPVRSGKYDERNANYSESRTQKANAHRLERMRKDRNTAASRQPGKAVKKATKADYGYRDKSSVNPDKLE